MFWRLTERVQPHFARSLVNAQMAVPSPAPREVAYIFPTFVHAAPVRLPVPAPPAKVTNSEANTPYGAPAIALTAFTGALFAADVLLARDFIEVLALMSGALASGLTKPRIILRAMYALISSAGDRACRSLNSAEAMRKLKVDLAGPPKGCREDGWNTENRRLADVSIWINLLQMGTDGMLLYRRRVGSLTGTLRCTSRSACRPGNLPQNLVNSQSLRWFGALKRRPALPLTVKFTTSVRTCMNIVDKNGINSTLLVCLAVGVEIGRICIVFKN